MRLLILFFVVIICENGGGTLYQCDTNALCGCSTSFTLVSRIAGGETAGRQSWSWTVSLRSHGKHFCGGTILSPSFIVTTALCIKDIYDLKSITILAGSLTLKPSSNDLSQVRSIDRIYQHPDYNSDLLTNDLALIRLCSPLNMKYGNIKPICLPPDTVPQPPDNISMIALGWGKTSMWTHEFSSTLRQVTVQSIASTYSGCKDLISDSKLQFCAGIITGGKDTCQGDGGGPLMAFVDNVWQIYGITSYGYGCALPGSPGVYTRVSFYIEWIKSIMSSEEVTATTISTSEEPITDPTSEESITDSTSEEPITDSTSEESITDSTSEEPITDSSSEEPITDSTSEQPVTDSTSEQPVTDSTSEEPITDSTSEQPVTDSSSEEPITDSSSEEPITDSTSEQPVTDSTSEEPITDSTSEQPVTDSTSEEPITDSTSEEPITDSTSEEPITDSTSEQPIIDSTSEERITDSTSEQPITDSTSEESMTTVTTTASTSKNSMTAQMTDLFFEIPNNNNYSRIPSLFVIFLLLIIASIFLFLCLFLFFYCKTIY
ncbi:unnamed protein product [Rotaria sp. Silwood2]|nr:unnamed protein product [Rotaria sp. Silwood2]